MVLFYLKVLTKKHLSSWEILHHKPSYNPTKQNNVKVKQNYE